MLGLVHFLPLCGLSAESVIRAPPNSMDNRQFTELSRLGLERVLKKQQVTYQHIFIESVKK